jgi:WD40 repeat protein
MLVSAARDGTIETWDLARRTCRDLPATDNKQPVCTLAFSPDGKTLTAAALDRTISRWEMASGLAPMP